MHTIQLDNGLTLKCLLGPQAESYFNDIAHFRIKLFAEFPYLYQGSLEYEKEYLKTYFASQDSLIILVFDGSKVVGFSSSIPLAEEFESITQPFLKTNMDISKFLYVGEAMLLSEYQGGTLLRQFAKLHEQSARNKNLAFMTFMTIVRPDDHPAKPQDYRKPDKIWKYGGCYSIPTLQAQLPWLRIDTGKEEMNTLQFWVKDLKKTAE